MPRRDAVSEKYHFFLRRIQEKMSRTRYIVYEKYLTIQETDR